MRKILLFFQFSQSFFDHAGNVIVSLVILLQAEEVLACIELLVHGYIYVGQEDKAACQPVSMRSALFNEIEHFLFGCCVIAIVIQLLGKQVFCFGTIECTCVFSQYLQVCGCLLLCLLVEVSLGTIVQSFVLQLRCQFLHRLSGVRHNAVRL